MTPDAPSLLGIPLEALGNLSAAWTFLLLITRFVAFFSVVPGIGSGAFGLTIRLPAIFSLAYASLIAGSYAPMPADWGMFVVGFVSEVLFGFLLGIIPQLIISGTQMAGHLASTTMGLGAAQLLDPTMGANVSEISKLWGDVVVLLFLILGGHHVAIYAVTGFGGAIVPGTFFAGVTSTEVLLDRTSNMFLIGSLIAAPVVVALLLTQFVMGLISKAVPTVNIFIVSFPLTVGIGLTISIMAMPGLAQFAQKEITSIETALLAASKDAIRVSGR